MIPGKFQYINLAKGFQRRRFLKIDQSEIKIACGHHVCIQIYRGTAIDASYQVTVHCAKWFYRRRLTCEK